MASGINDKELMDALTTLAKALDDEIQDAAKETANDTVDRLEYLAPVGYTGNYARSFKARKQRDGSYAVAAFKNHQWSLSHLIENGHATVNGGRTQAQPHFEPAHKEARDEFLELVEEKVSKRLEGK